MTDPYGTVIDQWYGAEFMVPLRIHGTVIDPWYRDGSMVSYAHHGTMYLYILNESENDVSQSVSY